LTRFYDSIIAATMRERLFRGRLADQVLADMPTEGQVADIGSGTGTFAVALAAVAPAIDVIGVDGDPDILEIARAKSGAGAVTWKPGMADDLPLADRSCDRVVMSLVLHHLDVDQKRAALAEAHRVLKERGRLHVADWGRAQDLLMRSTFFALQLFDGFAGTRDHVAGRLPEFIEGAGFSDLHRHDQLRTAWGSLELLSAVR